MNKRYTLIAFLALVFGACNPMDDIYDTLDREEEPIAHQVNYTLTDADYANVATIALSRKTAKDSAASKVIGSKKYFSESAKIADYVPEYLEELYPGLHRGSAVNVSYNFYEGAFAYINQYTLKAADYQKATGNIADYLSFNESDKADRNNMTKVLDREAEDGELLMVTYHMAEDIDGKTTGVWDFTLTKYDYQVIFADAKATHPQYVSGEEDFWYGVSTKNNNFNVKLASWQEKHGDQFTADSITLQVENGLKVLLKKKLGKEAVADMIYNVRYSTYGNNRFPTQMAFKCTAAGEAPAFEKTGGVDAARMEPQVAVYSYSTQYSNWSPYTKDDIYILSEADFDVMGIKEGAFSSGYAAANYLPQLLRMRFPFAQVKDQIQVVYRYANDSKKQYEYRIDEYTFLAEGWVNYNPVLVKTDQFINNGKWIFDPTINYTMVKADYDILVQWVKENKNGYFDAKYKNAEYWFGASTYKDNFDVRLTSRRPNDPDGLFSGKSDEEAAKIMGDQIQAGILLLLETKFKDALPQKDGVDVYYKITYLTYDGNNHYYTVTYKCIDTGKFELSEAPVEK